MKWEIKRSFRLFQTITIKTMHIFLLHNWAYANACMHAHINDCKTFHSNVGALSLTFPKDNLFGKHKFPKIPPIKEPR